jgi:hypothetical protein
MAIEVRCPNGHVLRVKDRFAGQSGLCPRCKARVEVPDPSAVTDDVILDVLGPPPPPPEPEPEEEEEAGVGRGVPDEVHQDPRHARDGSGISLLGSSILGRKKICPACYRVTSYSFKCCPGCGTPLWDATGLESDGAEK